MRTRSILAAIAALAIVATPVFAAGPFAQVDAGSSSIDFRPTVSGIELTLSVSGPDGFHFERHYGAGQTASFDLFDAAGEFVPAGNYTWELRAAPEMTDAQRDQMAELRAGGADAGTLQKAGNLPQSFEPMLGAFLVDQGAIVAGGATEEAAPAGDNRLATKAQVIATDLIVQGSECVGVDCTSSENFGFDTLRLKENNLRIKFEDTSVGTFPSNDWEIEANSSANGGANYLAIDDVTGGKTPFKVEAGAPTNSLLVESTGDIGINTSNPVVELHVVDGDTPTLRLEQNGSSGFTPQTFDLASNETNFFIRDVTNGSKLGFKYRPGAAENTLVIDNDSQVAIGVANATGKLHVKNGSAEVLWADTSGVGIGTASPSSPLHVSSDGSANVFVQDTSTTTSGRVLLRMSNNGPVRFNFENSSTGVAWQHQLDGSGNFDINQGAGGQFELAQNGNLTIGGTLAQNSSREIKHGFEPIDGRSVLERIVRMPLTTWIYDHDEQKTRHIGPMAEDFYAAFEVGTDAKHIAVSDQAGVALAAIQGLNQIVEEKDQEIDDLRTEVEELKRLVRELAEN